MSKNAAGKRMSTKEREKKGPAKRSKGGPRGRVDNTGVKVYDNWRKEARALGKEKKYVDIVIRPLVVAASAALAHKPVYAIPWNPLVESTSGAQITPNGAVIVPNLIPQGDTIVTRKDNSVKLRSLYIKGHFRPPYFAEVGQEQTGNEDAPALTSDQFIAPGQIRVMVVYDESPNGEAPVSVPEVFTRIFGLDGVGAKVLYHIPSSSTGNLQVASTLVNMGSNDSFQNMRGQGRFRLLADEYLPFGGCKVTQGQGYPTALFDASTPITIPYSRYLKLGGIATHYAKGNGADMDLTAIVKGALYVMCCYTEGQAGSINPVFEGCMRLRFDD